MGKESACNAGDRFNPWVWKIHWSRKWQLIPVFLPGKSHAWSIYSLSREEAAGKIAIFMGIDSADFNFPIYPGDQMRLEVDMPDIKSKFGRGEGCMIVNGKEASRTVMMFAIVDKV